MKRLILFLGLLTIQLMAVAQFEDQKTWLTVTADNNHYGTGLNRHFQDVYKVKRPSFTIAVDHYYSPFFDFTANLSLGKVNDYRNDEMIMQESGHLRANFSELSVGGIFKLTNGVLMPEDLKLRPFLGLGLSMISFNENAYEGESGSTFYVPVTTGVKYRFTDNLQMIAKISQKGTSKMRVRGVSLGFSFAFRAKIDSDNDGLYDYEDECPDEIGPLANNGCPYPDRDGDGIPDIQDDCPDLVGTVMGCPDSDKDGVKDAEDECPNTPGKLRGCPDQDEDGIADAQDKCPDVKGFSQFDGCATFELPIKRIYFNFGSAEIGRTYHPLMDSLVAMLRSHDYIDISVYGFTDDIGSDRDNLNLSKKRADAVRQYLRAKGVSERQLKVNGFGESKRVASNQSQEGRALNRRVEIELLNRDQ